MLTGIGIVAVVLLFGLLVTVRHQRSEWLDTWARTHIARGCKRCGGELYDAYIIGYEVDSLWDIVKDCKESRVL